jgi:transposase-like protein
MIGKRKAPRRITSWDEKVQISKKVKANNARAVTIAEAHNISTSTLYKIVQEVEAELAARAERESQPAPELPLAAPVSVADQGNVALALMQQQLEVAQANNKLLTELLEEFRHCWRKA